MAKQIIKFICSLGEMIENDPQVRDILKIVYLEDYRVTLSELLMPASEISEQISLAGTEASGTGNMKLMLNGAVTLGTWDGANVEIGEAVGPDNIFVFGMRTPEVNQLKSSGYYPNEIYLGNPVLKQAIDQIGSNIAGDAFQPISDSLKNSDPYMVLRDFESYDKVRRLALSTYQNDQTRWQKMSLVNIAQSGYFCADRAIQEYAHTIWNLD
jgi:starch phosphorylase